MLVVGGRTSLLLVVCAACGRTSLPDDNGSGAINNGDSVSTVAVSSFSVSGTISTTRTLPAGVLKLAGTSGSSYPPAVITQTVTLSFAGAPAVSTYVLQLDASELGTYSGFVYLYVFADTNGSDTIDGVEQFFSLAAATRSTPLFCDGVACSPIAIEYLPYGASGTGRNGSFDVGTGWYAPLGCTNGDLSCAALITEGSFTGIDLTF